MITPACRLAVNEFKRSTANVNRFWNLIYAVSAASALMLIAFIVTIAFSDRFTPIIPGVGAAMGGAGLGALVRLKNSAYSELSKARTAVRTDCTTATERGTDRQTDVAGLLEQLL